MLDAPSPARTPVRQALHAPDPPDGHPLPDHGSRETVWLRWVPPAAALSTAFVLQVVLVTDLVGSALAERMRTVHPGAPATVWFAAAGLLGLAVAACLEGGAAYLMDLYDRHLMARDSVWVLRVGMVVYVTGSAVMIHWWLASRGLPPLIAWVLAAMSGSALFLWSRGSRWRHRRAMQAAGQIDHALPRLPTASKILHPYRTLVTFWLITWGRPVRTPDEARRRFKAWQRARRLRRTGPAPQTARQTPDPVPAPVSRPRRTATGPARATTRPRPGPASDAADLATLTAWAREHGRLPSLDAVQRLLDCGRSKAVRLSRLLRDQTPDQEYL